VTLIGPQGGLHKQTVAIAVAVEPSLRLEPVMRALLIFAVLAGAAFASGCLSAASTAPGVERRSIYGQPCNIRSREAGLCRTVYRDQG
jgi:hypothetical protein